MPGRPYGGAAGHRRGKSRATGQHGKEVRLRWRRDLPKQPPRQTEPGPRRPCRRGSRAGHTGRGQPVALVLLRRLARLPDPARGGAVPPARRGVDRRRPGPRRRLLRHLHARPDVHRHAAARWRGPGSWLLAVLASVACAVYGKDWMPLWIYVSAAGGMVLSTLFDRARATLGIVVITGCYLFFCWLTHLDGADTLAVLLPVLLIGMAMIGFRHAARPDARAGPGPRDRGQAGRERGAAPAGPGHARPDRPVAVHDHAQVRAGGQAPDPAARLGRA